MKKITIITAILMVLMLLVSCGGGETGNPTGSGGNGGGANPLAGKTFSTTDFFSQEEYIWHFDADGNARNTIPSSGNTITLNYHYTLDTAHNQIILHLMYFGDEMDRAMVYDYEISGTQLTLKQALPFGKTLNQIAAGYWCPTFKTDTLQSSNNYMHITTYQSGFYDEGEICLVYKNSGISTATTTCSYTVDMESFTTSSFTATKDALQPEGYPDSITVSYTTSGSGESMTITATVPDDSYQYELSWEAEWDEYDLVTE